MTLYPPRMDAYPDPNLYPPVTPDVTPGRTLPQPSGPQPATDTSAPPPMSRPRRGWLATIALIFSLLALALAFSPFILALRPVPLLPYPVGGLVLAIVETICGHAPWSRADTSGWRVVVVVALILGYLALALGLFHILALFARELALRRRRAI